MGLLTHWKPTILLGWLLLALHFNNSLAAKDTNTVDTASRGGEADVVHPVGTNSIPLESYRLRSGDTLEVKVYQEEDLNARVRIDTEGTVILPLIGRTKVAGLYVDAAQKLIRDKYQADYLHHPELIVTITEFAPRRFVVVGQVVRPGVFEIPRGEKLNILQAIAMAGGFTKVADPSKVRILRPGMKGDEVIRINARAIAAGEPGGVPLVQDDDNITVGESAF